MLSSSGESDGDTSSSDDGDSTSWCSDEHFEVGVGGRHQPQEGAGIALSPHSSSRPTRGRSRHWRDNGISFESALRAERHFIEDKFEQRGGLLDGSAPFSVAFSGGGVRAAAFEAGIFWRLAQSGCLSRVEHIVAVSGGAYIACAVASHLVAAEQPSSACDMNGWYQRVVAKTICRMQRNVGYFVRDWSAGPFKVPNDGSGLLPPFADVPILVAVVLFTLVSNPLTHFVVFIIPITECVNQSMGMAMRAAYCAPTDADAWSIFEWWGPLHGWLMNLAFLLAFTFAAWLLGKLPFCRPPSSPGSHSTTRNGRHNRPPWLCRLGFLYLQSLRAATTRVLVVYACIIVIMCGVMSTQLWDRTPTGYLQRNQLCSQFILNSSRPPDDRPFDYRLHCDDLRRHSNGQWAPWWTDPIFEFSSNASTLEQEIASATRAARSAAPHHYLPQANETELLTVLAWPLSHEVVQGSSWFISTVLLLLLVLGVALLLTPIFKGLFLFCLSLVGPTVAVLVAASFMQYRIFGPLTGQRYIHVLGLWPFQRAAYYNFRLGSLVLAFVMMVFFHGIHFASHYFYSRSLRLAYFERGRDLTWQAIRRNPYIPFMLLTGTVTDWKRPGDKEKISEISISCLHTGSGKTGYVATPPWRSVGKCMALAAAATDAFILGMFDRLRYRFWLEFLNLRMGDYLLFERRRNPCVAWCQRRMPSCRRESFFFYEFPVVACGGSAFVLFIVASILSQSDLESRCQSSRHMYVASVYIVLTVFVLSFFGFVPFLEFFVHSPMLRQIHMAMRYYHISETPPSMIYVSDGGVQDCTGVLQLMLRRCGRILLALAAADPEDNLAVLRETMKIAVKSKLGSFYDPKDPRRDVSLLLDEFKRNRSQTYLHIGISYGWDRGEQGSGAAGAEGTAAGGGETSARPEAQRRTFTGPQRTGHLLVVKNRLPPSWEDIELEPPLTEAEIISGASWKEKGEEEEDEEESSEGGSAAHARHASGDSIPEFKSMHSFGLRSGGKRLATAKLGGCCCNCCHVGCCNLGPKFPHVANANQCLTPALFSSLCRLGHRLSQDAIELLCQQDCFEEPWEHCVQ